MSDIQHQTNYLQRNCLQLESNLTHTVSTGLPRITSTNLLLMVTQVKSASLLLHVTEGTGVCLLSHVTRVTSVISCSTLPDRKSAVIRYLGLNYTSPVKGYSGHVVKSPVKRCQIGSLLLYDTQVSRIRLLLNVARSEVSCFILPNSQVYVSCSPLRPTHTYVPDLHFYI